MIPCSIHNLGLLPFDTAMDLQNSLAEQRAANDIPDTLLLVEHPHTYSIGSRSQPGDILLPGDDIARLGIQVFRADRGGRVAYHGPGQLVCYPILRLPKPADGTGYLRRLEATITTALSALGIASWTIPKKTGVWTGKGKIGFIGAKLAGGVTKHGFAINVCPEMSFFEGIRPCGLTASDVTSMEELGWHGTIADVAEAVVGGFKRVFEFETAPASERAGAELAYTEP